MNTINIKGKHGLIKNWVCEINDEPVILKRNKTGLTGDARFKEGQNNIKIFNISEVDNDFYWLWGLAIIIISLGIFCKGYKSKIKSIKYEADINIKNINEDITFDLNTYKDNESAISTENVEVIKEKENIYFLRKLPKKRILFLKLFRLFYLLAVIAGIVVGILFVFVF